MVALNRSVKPLAYLMNKALYSAQHCADMDLKPITTGTSVLVVIYRKNHCG